MRLVALATAVLSLAAFAALRSSTAPVPAGDAPLPWPHGAPRVIDFHTHLDPGVLQPILGLFDAQGVGLAVNLIGVPPGPGLDMCLDMQRRSGRVVCFAGIDWRRFVEGGGDGAVEAADLVRAVRQGARGLKVPKLLGLGLPDPSRPRTRLFAVDDDRLGPVWEAAADLGVPVAIHIGDPVAFWEPLNPQNERWDELQVNPGWSYAGRPVPSHRALFDAQQRLFHAHPRTTFVAVHVAGFPEDLDAVDRLLDAEQNVMIDIAARIPELGRHAPDAVRAFFTKHQDRIVFGTDVGVSREGIMLGAPLAWQETQEDVDRFYDSTRRFLTTNDRAFPHPTPIQGRWRIDGIGLPTDVLEKVMFTNAARLLRIDAR